MVSSKQRHQDQQQQQMLQAYQDFLIGCGVHSTALHETGLQEMGLQETAAACWCVSALRCF
jgi:hypothetical protein